MGRTTVRMLQFLRHEELSRRVVNGKTMRRYGGTSFTVPPGARAPTSLLPAVAVSIWWWKTTSPVLTQARRPSGPP